MKKMKYNVPNWVSALTEQRDTGTGCIPWSYEWMLRLVKASCDFTSFQEEFNLQLQGQDANHFSNVANAISARYPDIEFKWQGFPKGEGKKKIQEVKKHVAAGTLCAYSLRNPDGNFHIMPVVAIDDDHMTLVSAYQASTSTPNIRKISDSEAAHIHDTFNGGDDFAWLAKH